MGTGMKTSEKLLDAAAAIESLLNEHPMAAPNALVPARIRFLAAQISGFDRYAAEKAYEIARLASIFFSDRKHSSYPGGPEALRAEMTFDLLGRIRSQASNRASRGD